ncbi:MAG: hypothetical protein Kow0037_26240 [Calditrichia bacterium]
MVRKIFVALLLFTLLTLLPNDIQANYSALPNTAGPGWESMMAVWSPVVPPRIPKLAVWSSVVPPRIPKLAVWNPVVPPRIPKLAVWSPVVPPRIPKQV